MVEAERPYTSASIEDLEGLFFTQGEEVSVLSQLVEELSHRKTKRARRLLALAAEKLADLEPEADESIEPMALDDELLSDEEDWQVPEHEDAGNAIRDATVNTPDLAGRPADGTAERDQPPDDRKRPERLSSVRPVGTPGLPSPWVRPLHADRPLSIAADADLPQIYAVALAALIAEIKTTGAGQKRYELENGIRAGEEAVYEFPFTDEADLFEDAKVELEISGRRIAGLD
jgi:hypothetical protein